ncbi:MAG: hypothetical protein ACRC0G_07610 [Fusobacteriaceae bacterium]
MLESIYILDLIFIAIAIVLIFVLSKIGPRFCMSKYFLKYVLLAEQIYFIPTDGKTRYTFVKDRIAEVIGSKSFLLRKIFEIALDEKTVHKFIEDTVRKNRNELDMIKESNSKIVHASVQIFQNKILDALPDTDDAVNVVHEVKEKNFNSDDSVSAFAELSKDFRRASRPKEKASVNIKL